MLEMAENFVQLKSYHEITSLSRENKYTVFNGTKIGEFK